MLSGRLFAEIRRKGVWGLKIFQFLIRFFFASGVGVLQLREELFGIKLSIVSMGKQERGGQLRRYRGV